MPAINFKKEFAADVESGKKRQTIRASRKRPVRPGETLCLYTGMRARSARLLREEVCKETLAIHIDAYGYIMLDGHWLTLTGQEALAHADGFTCWDALVRFFRKTHGLPFWGILIKW